MTNLKSMYSTIIKDKFPNKMEISFFDDNKNKQSLQYEKIAWDVEGKKEGLRYGDNPCQDAAFYKPISGKLKIGDIELENFNELLTANCELLQFGKHPGKTNLTDIDNGLNILRYFDEPCVVILKHNNPCGAAKEKNIFEAYKKAYEADITAAFGGCIVVNKSLDKDTSELIAKQYAEVVCAPEFEEGVVEILAKRKNLRIVKIKNINNLESFKRKKVLDFKSLIDGSIIIQSSFNLNALKNEDLKIAECEYKGKIYKVNRKPSIKEYDDMLFGWKVEAGISSNSVIYVKDGVTIGIGTGEQDRVGAAEIAVYKSYEKLKEKYSFQLFNSPYRLLNDKEKISEIDKIVQKEKGGLIGASMISDAFFPFRDGVDVGLKEGVSAIIHTGGSINDYQSIEACNEYNATMVYTGQRSFKH